jgi:hypothetical protein
MKSFEIFSVVGITITGLLGFYNLFINVKSQRKTQRELFFNRQFDYFMQLQGLIAEFEDAVSDMNENHTKLDYSQEQIFKLANAIDMLSSKNELIIPDSLYNKISDYSSFCHKISSMAYKEPPKINKPFKSELIDLNLTILDDLRDYIGIEHLSEENRKLVRGKVLNS